MSSSDAAPSAMSGKGPMFLCLVDESEEMSLALRFACRRAYHSNGRVGLLYVLEPPEMLHWMIADKLAQQEQRQEAEELLQVVAASVHGRTGKMPAVYIREGQVHEELLRLIGEEGEISALVLGASAGPEGPGSLVAALFAKMSGRLRIPITIVPASISDEDLKALA